MGAPQTLNTQTRPFPWAGLITLSALIFTAVTSEFLPTGLLPEIANELDVSISQAGFLVTIFAGTVVLTAAPLASLTRRFSRKSLIVVVLFVFVAGNVLAALAPTYEVLVVARVIGGLAHGLFWAVVGAYSAHLVPKHQIGRAVAITSAGGTAAFVLGVPLGAALGHAFGWRLAFGVIAVITVVLVGFMLKLLPPVEHREVLATGEIPLPLHKDRTIPGVIVVCLTVVIVMTGHNIFYTYISPFLIGPVGLDPSAVAGVLFLYGGAGAVGLVIAGMVSDRFPRAGFVVAIAMVGIAVLTLGLFPGVTWLVFAAIVVWGVAFGGTPAMLQTRMLHTASARVRDVAAAYFTTSFNVAIGGGALIGGILLEHFSITPLPFVDVAIIVVGIAFVLAGDSWIRRRAAAR